MGDLLRIDLTTRTSREETVPPELIKELIGAKGLGTHYLCEEVAPEVDPLSPAAKLIFAIGPMAGTTMLGSNRYGLFFASPLTNAYCECYSGGNLTPQFAEPARMEPRSDARPGAAPSVAGWSAVLMEPAPPSGGGHWARGAPGTLMHCEGA